MSTSLSSPHGETDRRWAVTFPQALLAGIVFAFVAWLIAHGYQPQDAVGTAAATLGLVVAVILIPRGALAVGRFLQRMAAAGLTSSR